MIGDGWKWGVRVSLKSTPKPSFKGPQYSRRWLPASLDTKFQSSDGLCNCWQSAQSMSLKRLSRTMKDVHETWIETYSLGRSGAGEALDQNVSDQIPFQQLQGQKWQLLQTIVLVMHDDNMSKGESGRCRRRFQFHSGRECCNSSELKILKYKERWYSNINSLPVLEMGFRRPNHSEKIGSYFGEYRNSQSFEDLILNVECIIMPMAKHRKKIEGSSMFVFFPLRTC
ncbi:hypothetical protein VNO77_05199 [Canavalia gladiata]|uniref:Uncharacterized protein n=1 Tax=Canavalia gladiata TaxID=3824 RepID=A0AAN9MXW6_CANGL